MRAPTAKDVQCGFFGLPDLFRWDRPILTITREPRMLKRTLLLILPAGLILLAIATHSKADNFVDYKPSAFAEQADAPFFFSLGDKLKYGTSISESAPTLLEADFSNPLKTSVYPSPDQTKAIVVVGDKVYLVVPGNQPRLILRDADNEVGSNHAIGDTFYRHYRLQWSSTSRYVLIPRDRKQASVASQFFSNDQALVRIDTLHHDDLQEIIIPSGMFRSSSYFLVNDETVCFNFEVNENTIPWRCKINGNTEEIRSISDNKIILVDAREIRGKPFASYHSNIKETELWLTHCSFFMAKRHDESIGFFRRDRPNDPYFVVNSFYNFKGNLLDGLLQEGAAVLPGGRFVFLKFYDKTILLDSRDRRYKALPFNAHCYVNFNSADHAGSFGVVSHGSNFLAIEFKPAYPLRTNYRE